jgi:hypothetical protein
MKMPRLASLVLSFVIVVSGFPAVAFETDQYNLPPEPLADVGDEVAEYVLTSIRLAVDKVNVDIARTRACIDQPAPRPKGCGDVQREKQRLTVLTSDDAVGAELYHMLGGNNILVTKFGKWMLSHKFSKEPSSYKAPYLESIYLTRPANYLTISPTVKLYGIEFGVDKLEHLFQQGYRYQEIRQKAEREGASPEDAVKKAIAWGQKTERTYFGLLTSGVYSNADLYANYAGMKFYEGLTKTCVVGDVTRPATVFMRNGRWQLDDSSSVRETLLTPFITEHLNEVLNPSSFALTLYPFVRKIIKKRGCPEWRAGFPALSRIDLNDKTRSLELWYGEDYGFTKKKRSPTIGDMCFGEPGGPGSVPVAAV